MPETILILDDEPLFLETLVRGLRIAGLKDVESTTDPHRAIERVMAGDVDVALIDVNMPRMGGVEVLERIRRASPRTECLMVSAVDDARTAMECIKRGAYDYLVKPVVREDLTAAVDRALERKRLFDLLEISHDGSADRSGLPPAFDPLVSQAGNVLKVLKQAALHAQSQVPCLITGESGTGKELLARALHQASPRHGRPFVAVNMASVSLTLFDSEFFGHTRGAFTGADADREGFLEAAEGGTLFLDEIGHLSPDLQGKLLRVLQEGEYSKLGRSRTQKADIRFIAATNADLADLMARDRFRKDLYYRLKGAWLALPPLREREGDVPLLVRHLLDKLPGRPGVQVSPEALELLNSHDYPGNVRELASILSAAANLSPKGLITPAALPGDLRKKAAPPVPAMEPAPRSLADVEREHILGVYRAVSENKAQAARVLGIGINTLRRKLESYGIS